MKQIAALYIDPKGPYPSLGVDCWDAVRDARKYAGPWPIIAHPPCGRWSSFAKLNEARWGAKVGDDGGCFEAALAAVRQYGGVLEHPAKSLAWDAVVGWNLPKPHHSADAYGGYCIEVQQVKWGFPAQKKTWLYLVGVPRGALEAPPFPDAVATHWVGNDRKATQPKPTLHSGKAKLTPVAFAEYLIRLAQSVIRG